MRPRWISAVLHGFAILICALIFNLVSVGASQAHVLHPHEETQLQTLPAGSVERGETASEDGLASVERECSVKCCSLSHCASGLAGASEAAVFIGCVRDPFVLAPAQSAMSFDQGTLKRPPKS